MEALYQVNFAWHDVFDSYLLLYLHIPCTRRLIRLYACYACNIESRASTFYIFRIAFAWRLDKLDEGLCSYYISSQNLFFSRNVPVHTQTHTPCTKSSIRLHGYDFCQTYFRLYVSYIYCIASFFYIQSLILYSKNHRYLLHRFFQDWEFYHTIIWKTNIRFINFRKGHKKI